jgi:thiol-disulfide isomerase/thioredoxin
MAEWFDDTLVKLLTGAHFEDKEPWKLKDNRCAFIFFFADWCGHCKNFKPEYIKFADMAQFIRVHAVDSQTETTLMERLNDENSPLKIKGYPTVWIYRSGEPYEEYNGPRTSQGLLKRAMELCDEGCNCEKPKRKLKKQSK